MSKTFDNSFPSWGTSAGFSAPSVSLEKNQKRFDRSSRFTVTFLSDLLPTGSCLMDFNGVSVSQFQNKVLHPLTRNFLGNRVTRNKKLGWRPSLLVIRSLGQWVGVGKTPQNPWGWPHSDRFRRLKPDASRNRRLSAARTEHPNHAP